MTWNKTVPNTGSDVIDTPTIYQDNWIAISDGLATEHEGMDSASAGAHNPKSMPSMLVSTSVAIAAITNPQTGAIAWDTDKGVLEVLSGGWNSLQDITGSTEVYAVMSASRELDFIHVYPNTGIYFIVPLYTEVTDKLGEWDATNCRFAPKTEGYFKFTAQATLQLGWVGTGVGTREGQQYNIMLGLSLVYPDGAIFSDSVGYSGTPIVSATGLIPDNPSWIYNEGTISACVMCSFSERMSIYLSHVIYLSAGQSVSMAVWSPTNSATKVTINVSGATTGTKSTFLSINRVG